jgi:hypothetical protein
MEDGVVGAVLVGGSLGTSFGTWWAGEWKKVGSRMEYFVWGEWLEFEWALSPPPQLSAAVRVLEGNLAAAEGLVGHWAQLGSWVGYGEGGKGQGAVRRRLWPRRLLEGVPQKVQGPQ